MRIGLFYISPRMLTSRHKWIDMGKGVRMFVRGEIVEAASETDALDMAKIMPGEAFMNSHSLELEDYEEKIR